MRARRSRRGERTVVARLRRRELGQPHPEGARRDAAVEPGVAWDQWLPAGVRQRVVAPRGIPASLRAMEVRIGVKGAPRELVLDSNDTADNIEKAVAAA